MRTIKFRGLAYSGGWVYGNYIHSKRFAGAGNEHRIVCQDTGLESDVIPETVGQFTNLYDVNGNEIYEKQRVNTKYCDCLVVKMVDGTWCFVDIYENPTEWYHASDHIKILGVTVIDQNTNP